MNAASVIRASVAVIGLAVAAVLITRAIARGDDTAKRYFYDLSEQRLYAVKVGGPIPDPGVGGASNDGYPATVIACGDCGDAASRRAAYLEQPTPELQQWTREAEAAKERGEPSEMPARSFFTENTLVRLVEGDEWHTLASADGAAISENANKKCEDGSRPRICLPD